MLGSTHWLMGRVWGPNLTQSTGLGAEVQPMVRVVEEFYKRWKHNCDRRSCRDGDGEDFRQAVGMVEGRGGKWRVEWNELSFCVRCSADFYHRREFS
jgi:hypothetical protein